MEFKNRVIRVENIPMEFIVYREKTKPVRMLIYVLIVGLGVFFFQRILGIFLISITTYALFVVREDSLLDFTDRFIIIRDQPNKSECTIVYWRELSYWAIVASGKNNAFLKIYLDDGAEMMIYIVNVKKVREVMRKYAPKKEVEA